MPYRLVSLTLLLVLAMAVGATAAEPADVDVSSLAPWQGRPVTSLTLDGLPTHLEAGARSGLALTPRRKLWRRRTTTLTLPKAEADARRLRLLLARHGYPASSVRATATADGDEDVAVTLHIDPGPLWTLGPLDITGLPAARVTTTAADSVRIRLPHGHAFIDQQVQAARADLELAMQRAGHAHPEVVMTVQPADSHQVHLSYLCRPGPRFRYADARVDGLPDDLHHLALRTINLEPGCLYSPAVAARARGDLRRLQLFRQVRLTSEARTDTTLDLVATLSPRRMISLEASVGSYTDDWLVAELGITHRNLLGGGRGGKVSLRTSTHEHRAEAGLCWPARPFPWARSELTLSGEIQDEESYRLDILGAELATVLEAWTSSSLRLSLEVSQGTLDDRSTDSEAFVNDVGLLSVVSAKWYRDTSDHPMDPRVGSRLTLETGWSPPGFWTDNPLAGGRASASRYWPLGAGTLAMRVDAGLIRPLGDATSLRPDHRFFAGGVGTMRGYRRHELGPRDADGAPVGGEVRLLLGTELRRPVKGPLGVALFVDAGQVWATRHDIDLADLAVAAGMGLLVGTPVGPVRLDLAGNLTEPSGDATRWLLSLAIGHPY